MNATASALPTETESATINSQAIRDERGRQLAASSKIKQIGSKWAVPSQSGTASAYVVDLVEESCSCPDWELRRQPCKHIHATYYWVAWGRDVGSDGSVTETVTIKRKTYRQNWPAYNAAQTTEKAQVELLLKSLCDGIEEPTYTFGRPRLPLRTSIFAACMKVYTGFSGRRASTDIASCAERGHIEDAPHYNSIARCLENDATTAILINLIEQSAGPLAQIENVAGQFAIDSTGFSSVFYDRWFDQKHGKLQARHGWTKLHLMCGTVTNVVTAAKVSTQADGPVMPELIDRTKCRFTPKEVSGDKAYLSKKNLKVIEQAGAVPFIPFKSNSLGLASKSPHWRRMWAHFSLKAEDFIARYHRRSNVESVMWMIKSKFGGAVRSKLPTAQANEVLCKVLLHNLTCIVHAVAEFGIEVDFGQSTPVAQPQPEPVATGFSSRPYLQLVPPISQAQMELLK